MIDWGFVVLNMSRLVRKKETFVPRSVRLAIQAAEARIADGENVPPHTHAQSDVTGLSSALSGKEPANANIQAHIASAHAPADAQKNSDITKAEIEAKLTGEISTHTHAGGSGGLTQSQILARGLGA